MGAIAAIGISLTKKQRLPLRAFWLTWLIAGLVLAIAHPTLSKYHLVHHWRTWLSKLCLSSPDSRSADPLTWLIAYQYRHDTCLDLLSYCPLPHDR